MFAYQIIKKFVLLILGLFGFTPIGVAVQSVPDISHSSVMASVVHDSATQEYTYRYSVISANENFGNISGFMVDITTLAPSDPDVVDANPYIRQFKQEMVHKLADQGIQVIRVRVWDEQGNSEMPYDADGMASWYPGLSPGERVDGLTLTSRAVPAVREYRLTPGMGRFSHLFPYEDDSDEVIAEKQAFIASLDVTGYTLGPALYLNIFEHWDAFAGDIKRLAELGWITDATLQQTLLNTMTQARAALDAGDGSLAKTQLQSMIEVITQAAVTQRRQEAYDLIVLNAEFLIARTADTPLAYQPVMRVISSSNTEPKIGELYSVTFRVENAADHFQPVTDAYVFIVIYGTHSFFKDVDIDGRESFTIRFCYSCPTDHNGEVTFKYIGQRLGADEVYARVRINPRHYSFYPDSKAIAKVNWSGGPDLGVAKFIPPVVKVQHGRPIKISDITQNSGNVTAPPSLTRYYLSTDEPPFDIHKAITIGERSVLALAPDEMSEVTSLAYTVPDGLAEGMYYMAACADSLFQVAELEESNNCSFSTFQASTKHLVMPVMRAPNQAPQCQLASVDKSVLWPPNHDLTEVQIVGVYDPDDEPVKIQVDEIYQNEAELANGSGNTSPDALIHTEGRISLRAERNGGGQGRIYTILFSAVDPMDARCNGEVTVSVPHNINSPSNSDAGSLRFVSIARK